MTYFKFIDIKYNKQPIIDFCLKYKDKWYPRGSGWESPHLELRPNILPEILEDFVFNPEVINIYKQLDEQIHEGRIFFKFYEPGFSFKRHKDNQRQVGIILPLNDDYSNTPLEFLDNEFNLMESCSYSTPIVFDAQVIHQVAPIKTQRWQMQVSLYEPFNTYIRNNRLVK
jgi:hypothetical protein